MKNRANNERTKLIMNKWFLCCVFFRVADGFVSIFKGKRLLQMSKPSVFQVGKFNFSFKLDFQFPQFQSLLTFPFQTSFLGKLLSFDEFKRRTGRFSKLSCHNWLAKQTKKWTANQKNKKVHQIFIEKHNVFNGTRRFLCCSRDERDHEVLKSTKLHGRILSY